ncbi:dTDP-4-dehydrorhamnose reductase [Planococcus sp. SSTMD024]|uniref:dTDP-4-dehydrorhamnose reductase n=1 Tax=Planococcus sp. SSTMD024 TaxID=3242163 RepID=UPI00351E3758
MKILVTGVTGQLGYDVVRRGKEKGLNMVGISSKELDITNKPGVEKYIKNLNPDAVIHCAAYTAVDKAEDEREVCWKVNVEGTKYLAEAAKTVNAKFIYISTDYVFDGSGEEPFEETGYPNPIGTYGKTKLEGELRVKEALEEYFIVRISWVFGVNGNNFVKTMLKLAESREELNVVGDQYGSPTYTFDLADILLEMVLGEKYGIYHASNEGYCNWADFAKEIFVQSNIEMKVNAITTEEYPTKARRPLNSRMSKQRLEENGFNLLPPWQDAVKRYLYELKSEVKL